MGTFCEEALLHRSYEAFLPFRLCSTYAVGFSLRGNSFGCFATGTPLLFPALQVVRGRGGGLGMHLVLCPGGASSPPAGSRSSERGRSASGLLSVVRERALASLAPSGAGEGGVARSQRFFYARYAPRLSLTIPHRTLDDVGNCRRLRRIATAFYPLVVPDLRITVHGGIRELVHGQVVFVERGRFSRSRSSSR